MPEALRRLMGLMLLCGTLWHPVVLAETPLHIIAAQTLVVQGVDLFSMTAMAVWIPTLA